MACEMIIDGFRDSFNVFWQSTWYKWSFWLANDKWPVITSPNGTLAIEQGVDTPNTIGVLFGLTILCVLSTIKSMLG